VPHVPSVIGLSDGLTVPFALTAGLSSLGESRLVVVGGVAELIAGAISMGIGGFRASPYSQPVLLVDVAPLFSRFAS
jgi:VIT family